jgi:predicted  nucleic acid-binding Zn-ribbon protein
VIEIYLLFQKIALAKETNEMSERNYEEVNGELEALNNQRATIKHQIAETQKAIKVGQEKLEAAKQEVKLFTIPC